jgi:hypothetical protein
MAKLEKLSSAPEPPLWAAPPSTGVLDATTGDMATTPLITPFVTTLVERPLALKPVTTWAAAMLALAQRLEDSRVTNVRITMLVSMTVTVARLAP